MLCRKRTILRSSITRTSSREHDKSKDDHVFTGIIDTTKSVSPCAMTGGFLREKKWKPKMPKRTDRVNVRNSIINPQPSAGEFGPVEMVDEYNVEYMTSARVPEIGYPDAVEVYVRLHKAYALHPYAPQMIRVRRPEIPSRATRKREEEEIGEDNESKTTERSVMVLSFFVMPGRRTGHGKISASIDSIFH